MKRMRWSRCAVEPVSHDPNLRKRVLLRCGDVTGLLQLAHCRLPAGSGTTAHVHEDMTEIFVVVGGRGRAVVGTRNVRLEQYDCIVIEPGERHRIVADSGAALSLIYFGVPSSSPVRSTSRMPG